MGLNDGLVEILGAVSGFFAAFSNPVSVLIAGLTVAVAGSFSMAAGVYVATGSRNEVAGIEEKKREFLTIKRRRNTQRKNLKFLHFGGTFLSSRRVGSDFAGFVGRQKRFYFGGRRRSDDCRDFFCRGFYFRNEREKTRFRQFSHCCHRGCYYLFAWHGC